MTDLVQPYDLAAIRKLLLAAFTAEGLRRFCHDRPVFRPVVVQFGPGQGLDDMVDEVITHAEKRALFAELLAAVKEENPKQYACFESQLGGSSTVPASPATPAQPTRKEETLPPESTPVTPHLQPGTGTLASSPAAPAKSSGDEEASPREPGSPKEPKIRRQGRIWGGVPLPVWFLLGVVLMGVVVLLFSRPLRCVLEYRITEAQVALVVFLAGAVAAVIATLVSASTRKILLSFYGGVALVLVLFIIVAAWLLPPIPSGECPKPTPTPTNSSPPTSTLPPSTGIPIAFTSERDGNREIYVMNADGTRQTRLTQDPGWDEDPSWSPDGRHIAFASEREGDGDIFVMSADGSELVNLTRGQESFEGDPYWSADGTHIAFESDRDGQREIYAMNRDGSGQINLTRHPSNDWQPSWSPEGKQIAFVSDRDDNYEIYVMNADGTEVARLTNSPAGDWDPVWSPDGKRIAFSSERDGNGEIYVMNADGTGLVNLTGDPSDDYQPSWSPDGNNIAFASDRTGNYEVYVIKSDGSNQQNLTRDPGADLLPAWSPSPKPEGSWARPADGMVQVYVPAGSFWMGSEQAAPNQAADEQPPHEVYIDSYWIDLTEITNRQYGQCVEAGSCSPPALSSSNKREGYYGDPAFKDYPAVYVTWDQANVYCEWAGARLPSEAEWEKAACGGEPLSYPWGDGWDVAQANTMESGLGDTSPAAGYPAGASPYGALDMAGNVWEWVVDWYGDGYYATSPFWNPLGPDSGRVRIIRGGAWDFDRQYARTTTRLPFSPTNYDDSVGFRCALSTGEPSGPSARILAPSEGELVSASTLVRGQVRRLPSDHLLWVFVQYLGNAGYYPQVGPVELDTDGAWQAVAGIGTVSDVEWNVPYTITVVMADREASQQFSDFLAEWPAGSETGLNLPDGTTVLDEIRVVRTNPIVSLKSHAPGDKVGNRETMSGTYRFLEPGVWRLYGIVAEGDGRFVPYGPFEPQVSEGEWTIDAEFPWPADGTRRIDFYTLAVLAGTHADRILESTLGSPLQDTDLSDQDWSQIYDPHTQTTLTRSERIAFASDKPGNDDIFVIDIDGTGRLRVTDDQADDFDPAWSPDASQLAFVSNRENDTFQLYVIHVGDQEPHCVNTEGVIGIRGPTWSPDGQWIAFSADKDGNADIFKARVDGTDLTRLTDHPGVDVEPAWSPDGTHLVFWSDRAEDDADLGELYIMDTGGGEMTRLTSNQATESQPAWSPDGEQIIFRRGAEGESDIYRINADGSNEARLANVDYDQDPSFAPDGNRFVFASSVNRQQIFLSAVEDGRPAQIKTALALSWAPTWSPVAGDERLAFVGRFNGDWEIYTMWDDGTGLVRMADNDSREVQPRVSPDGRWVAFASDVDGDFEIWLEDARAPAEWIRLTDNTSSDLYPSWSPDGQKLTFASDRSGYWDIYVMNRNATGVAQLTNDPEEDGLPCWSPDGQHIAFYSMRSGAGDIYVMDANGENVEALVTDPSWDWSPAWSPDGRTILFASTRGYGGTYATDLYALDLDSKEQRRLTYASGSDAIPLWSSDGRRVYFSSDRGGFPDVWVMDASAQNDRDALDLTEDDRADTLWR